MSQLQDILTKKDVEIKALKEGAAGSSDSNVWGDLHVFSCPL